MDEEPSTGGPGVERTEQEADAEQPRDPERIRRDIEATREELGETVEALAAKTDVKAQARAKLDERRDELKTKVDERRDELKTKVDDLRERASDATPPDAQEALGQAADRARERPVPVAAAAAFAAGVLVGMLLRGGSRR